MKLVIISILFLHLVLVTFCFGLALYQPGRSGLLPILVYFTDYPASLLAEWVRRALHDAFAAHGYDNRLLIDAAVYALIGSAWWLFLILAIRRLARDFFTRTP